MTFLITGATGFLGRPLVNRLLAAGHSVCYIGRRRDSKQDSRAFYHPWDLMTEAAPLEVLPDFDAVIHLAGDSVSQRWTDEVKRRILDARVIGTRNLIVGLRKLAKPPMVLISASAIGYYGDRGDELLNEQSQPGEGFLADVCRNWEEETNRARDLGMRAVSVRIGIVLGPGGGALGQMVTPFKLGLGGPFGNGKQWMSWIQRDDLLSLFEFAARRDGLEGPINGVAPAPVTNRDFVETLGSVLHRPAILPAPRFGLKALLGEFADSLFSSARVLPVKAESLGFTFKHADLRPALKASL